MGSTCGLFVEPDSGSDRRKTECADSTAVSRIQKGGEYFFLRLLLKKQPDYRTCEHNTWRVETCPLSINSLYTGSVVCARNMHTALRGTFPLSILYTDRGVEGFS